MKIYLVFHPWLLNLCENQPLQGQHQQPPAPVFVDEENPDNTSWNVEEIIDSRMNRRKFDHGTRGLLEYKAKYSGDDKWNANPIWQPWHDFECDELIKEFHHRYPRKAGLQKTFENLDGSHV